MGQSHTLNSYIYTEGHVSERLAIGSCESRDTHVTRAKKTVADFEKLFGGQK